MPCFKVLLLGLGSRQRPVPAGAGERAGRGAQREARSGGWNLTDAVQSGYDFQDHLKDLDPHFYLKS